MSCRRLLTSPRWTLVGTSLTDTAVPMTAGRTEGLSWQGYGPPEVFVVGEHLLAAQVLAMHIVGWTGSVFAFERAVPQAYVRLPLEQLPTEHSDLLPVGSVAHNFESVRLGEGVLAEVARRRVVQADDQYGNVWQVALDELWLSVSAWGWPPACYVLSEDGDQSLVELPGEDEIIDAADIPPSPAPRRRKRKKAGHRPDVHATDDPDEPEQWTVQDWDLADLLGLPHAGDAEAAVQAELAIQDPGLAERVEWDSELSCFFAYCPNEDDAEALADLISDLVQRRTATAP